VASRATFAFNDPGASSSRLPEFAWPRCLQERPTTAELPRRCIVRINEHGSKDRVKDASRSACNGVPCLRPVPTRKWRRTTSFPSLATFGHPLSPARSFAAEEAAATDNEPTEAFVPTTPREESRLPENRDAFDRHDTRRSSCRGEITPSGLRAGSLAHAAHTFSPGWGECFCRALRVSRCGHPRSVTIPSADGSRVLTPFSLSLFAPGTDDPSTPESSTDSAVDGS
jgi:hypothetical protein